MGERTGQISKKDRNILNTTLRGNVEVDSEKQKDFSFFVSQESREIIDYYEESEIVMLSYYSLYDMGPDDSDCFEVKIKSIKKNCVKLTRQF